MNYRVFILVFLFGIISSWAQDPTPNSSDANIQLKTYLELDEVPQNGEVVYKVELIWNGELDRYQISNIGEPVITNLKLRGSGSSNRYFIDDTGKPTSIKQVNFYFTPIEIGMAYIDGITIQYEDKEMAQKETLSAQRLGVKIIEPREDPTAGMDIGLIIIFILVIIFMITVIYFLIRFLQQRKLNAEAELVQHISTEDKYLELLNSIDLSAESRNETLSALSKLVSSYLFEKFNLSFITDFDRVKIELENANISAELLDKINNLYERDKLSKFAREQVSENELHLSFDSVEQLINNLKNKEIEHNEKK